MSAAAADRAGEWERLCSAVASRISDYRSGDRIDAPTADAVGRWVQQFDDRWQIGVLDEIDHVLARTYFARPRVEAYLRGLLRDPELVGPDPSAFWRSVGLLDLQPVDRSQGAMLALLTALLEEDRLGGEAPLVAGPTYLYIDDGVYSGAQLARDLSQWIESDLCPARARVWVVCLALHRSGQWNAIRPDGRIAEARARSGKSVEISWKAAVEIEDRLANIAVSDVLRPHALPEDPRVRDYASGLERSGHPVVLRGGDSRGHQQFFSSGVGRRVLEQQLLVAGTRARDACPMLNGYQRPLGYTRLHTLGFGTLMVTYRNCPNNVPVALWAGDPWIPLFPRRTN